MLDRLAAKRALDLVLSRVLTILFAPLMLTLSRLLMLDLLILFTTNRVVLARAGNCPPTEKRCLALQSDRRGLS